MALTEEGRAKRAALDARIEARMRICKIEQQEILGELRAEGLVFEMLNNLALLGVSASEYKRALPILLKHLNRTYSKATLESIAYSMARKEAAPCWDDLVAIYRNHHERKQAGEGDATMAIAFAVSASCPSARLDDLIALLRDRTLPHRLLLLIPLKRRRGRNAAIAQVIEELREDPDLVTEICSWKALKG